MNVVLLCREVVLIGSTSVKVCVRDVLQHLVGVIEHSKLSKMWIASDYVHLLLNHVLNSNKFIYAITPKEWNGTYRALTLTTVIVG